MLNNYHILILGGDHRYLFLLTNLAEKNAHLSIIGFDEYTFLYPNINHEQLDNLDFSSFDAIILPVTGTSSTGEIVPTFSKQKIYITADQIKNTNEHCIIFSGTSNQFLKQITEHTERKLITLFERDDVAILNSIPTAEATLKLAIEHTNYTIHNANVFVLGFGRVGMTTARLFQQVGANVTVVARNDAHFARIKEMKMTSLHIEQLQNNIQNVQIIINTIPHLTLTREIIQLMTKDSLIIDLASHPGGTNFSAAKDYDIQALHALGLPGKTAPKTAGEILSNIISNILQSTH